jgi:hypothetical protein
MNHMENTMAIPGKYSTYRNWQLHHDLLRLSEAYRRLREFKSQRADETLYNERKRAEVLAQLDKICDEMNIRGI